MKFLSVIVLAALFQSPSSASNCTNVSIEGDSTFCVNGPVCSGPGNAQAGSACPVVGDVSVADCHPYNPSFDAKSGKCVATVPALCKPVKTGVWGCVWDLSGVSPAPAGNVTSAPAGNVTSAPAGNVTPAPAGMTSAPATDLVDVQVADDGVFKVKGPACGGPAANQTGKACPVVGDVAVSGCTPTSPSLDKASGKCVAPVPARCQPTQNNTVWGCVWDLSSLTSAPATAVSAATMFGGADGGNQIGMITAFAGVAAVVAIVAAVIASKRSSAKQAASSDLADLELSPHMT